nr:unnamed protein product [Callosobruchus analis]
MGSEYKHADLTNMEDSGTVAGVVSFRTVIAVALSTQIWMECRSQTWRETESCKFHSLIAIDACRCEDGCYVTSCLSCIGIKNATVIVLVDDFPKVLDNHNLSINPNKSSLLFFCPEHRRELVESQLVRWKLVPKKCTQLMK